MYYTFKVIRRRERKLVLSQVEGSTSTTIAFVKIRKTNKSSWLFELVACKFDQFM